jgi:putrescine transport system substrate-binding protein
MRIFSILLALLTLPLALNAQAPAAPANTVRINNFSNYIAPSVLKDFEAKTGMKVVYNTFDSVDTAQAQLLAKNSGYDIVVVSTYPYAAELLKLSAIAKVDNLSLRNFGLLDASILEELATVDRRNSYLVPYLWGTTGIGINSNKAKALLSPTTRLDSWGLIFDPVMAAKLSSCGISVLDDQAEGIAAALIYLKKSPSSVLPADLVLVENLFKKIRPFIKTFTSDYVDILASGEICMAMAYSGDAIQARTDADKAKGVVITYVLPREGATRFLDVMVIPIDSKNTKGAHLFMDYILEPQVIAKISNEIGYANPNPASLRFLTPAVRKDTGIYPPPDVANRLVDLKPMAASDTAIREALWQRIKQPVK